MDEQLKARLIGASILVVIAVLLVPELLSGRKSGAPAPAAESPTRGMRTYTIDLSGASAPASSPAAAPEIPAAPVKDAPPPHVEAPQQKLEPALKPAPSAPTQASPPVSEPVTQPAKSTAPAAKPPAPEKPAPAPAKGGWSVQVGAFSSAATADKLVGDLKSAGYKAYVAPIPKSGKTLHRVRVGPEASRADADKLAARLKSRGLPATVVGND